MSEIPILPPLKNSTPRKPHERRTNQVFLALDKGAALGLSSYAELIDFVRDQTGTGCSRKLISRWKKEKERTSAPIHPLPPDDVIESYVEPPEPATVNDLQLADEIAIAPSQQPEKRKFSVRSLLLKTPLKRLLLPAAALGVGLSVIAGQSLPSLSDRAAVVVANSPSTTDSSANSPNPPRQLKFNLSVSSPADLKVKQGDAIEAGQMIAERVEERDRLKLERNSLNLQYQQIQSRQIPKPQAPVIVPSVRQLLQVSYAEEEAAIRAAETNLRQAEKAFQHQQERLKTAPLEESNAVERAAVEVENRQRLLDNQKRKIEAIKLLKDLPDSVPEHEQEVLRSKEADFKQAQADHQQATAKLEAASRSQIEKLQQLGAAVEKARADLQVAISKLQTKKDTRAYQEYDASINTARRAEEQNRAQESYARNLLEAEQQERDRSFALSQIKAKINDVNNQISALSVITSPYSGTVKAIKFQKQSNADLLVELTLTVRDATTASNSPDATNTTSDSNQ